MRYQLQQEIEWRLYLAWLIKVVRLLDYIAM